MSNPELGAIEVQGMTRSAFILRGALAAGALYGAGAVAPFVSGALAQGTSTDEEILSFALGLEELEAAFYAAALKQSNLSSEVKTLATEFGKQEAAHADALKTALSQLGGQAPAAVKPKFSIKDEQSFLKLAVALEDTGVGAYNGAAPKIKSADVISAAGSIVQVEARHAAAMRVHANMPPAPAAFDKPLTAQQVAAAVKQATGG